MRKVNFSYLIMDICLLICGIEAIFPPVSTIANATLVSSICLMIWFLLSFCIDNRFYAKLRNLYPLVFALSTFAIPYFCGYPMIGNRYLNLCLIPFGFLIFSFYRRHDRLSNLKRVILIMGVFAVITFFVTLRALIKDPYISRSIKSVGDYSKDLAKKGIGGYSFIYFITVISQLLLYSCLKTRSMILKLCTGIGYLLTLYFVLKSNYMTAFLIVGFASVVLLFLNFSNRKYFILLFAIFSVALFVMTDAFITFFPEIIPKRIAKVILADNGKFVLVSIWDEFIYDRWPVMQNSIAAFLEHPVQGILFANGLTTENGEISGFGQHSYILDTFSLFGFLIGIINVVIIFKPFRGMFRKCSNIAINFSMLICTMGIYLFNNATPAIAMALGVIFPLIREIFSQDKKIEVHGEKNI